MEKIEPELGWERLGLRAVVGVVKRSSRAAGGSVRILLMDTDPWQKMAPNLCSESTPWPHGPPLASSSPPSPQLEDRHNSARFKYLVIGSDNPLRRASHRRNPYKLEPLVLLVTLPTVARCFKSQYQFGENLKIAREEFGRRDTFGSLPSLEIAIRIRKWDKQQTDEARPRIGRRPITLFSTTKVTWQTS
jgi:hypothetical protein